MSATPTLWCRACQKGLALVLRWDVCPMCQQKADWSEECPVPLTRWNVTVDDWTFLRIQKIDPERETEALELTR